MFRFGPVLKALRKDKDWTQKELAGRLGLHRITVLKWEQDEEAPTAEHLYAIERWAGVPRGSLVIQRALNKMEVLGADLRMLVEPEVWIARGLGPPIQKGMSERERLAVALMRSGNWASLGELAKGKGTPAVVKKIAAKK